MEQQTIALYESIAALTSQMLQAARAQDWDKLGQLEQRSSECVAQLKALGPVTLSGEARQRKVVSVKQILADDREIRNLASPWMLKLNAMMHGGQSDKSSAYGS